MHLRIPIAYFISSIIVIVETLAEDSPRRVDAVFLDQLRSEARQNHPAIAAALAREAAAQAAVNGVRLWEDPAMSLSVMAARPPMRRDEGDFEIAWEQTLPRPNLYRAKRLRALTELRIREEATRSAVTSLEMEAAKKALELALADELIRLLTEEVEWLDRMTITARDQVADPQSNAAEALRLESERVRQIQSLQELITFRQAMERQLNIFLGRSPEHIWSSFVLGTNGVESPEIATTLEKLARLNPELRGLRAMTDAARSEIAVAERERSPTFSVGVGTRVYSGGSIRSGGLGVKITLPWFNDHVYRAAIEEARLQEEASRRDFDSKWRELEEEVIDVLSRIQTNAEQSAAYRREIIPAAGKAAEAMEGAWISSRATLVEALDAQRAALTARVDERRFAAAALAALEDLRALVPPTPIDRLRK